jgi:ligand-binding sensor domain-containing protein
VAGDDVWIGGETGVEVLRRNRFFPLRLEGGEPLRGVTGLAFAPDGALWINQSSGVLRVDKGEIAAGLSDPNYTTKFRALGETLSADSIVNPSVVVFVQFDDGQLAKYTSIVSLIRDRSVQNADHSLGTSIPPPELSRIAIS